MTLGLIIGRLVAAMLLTTAFQLSMFAIYDAGYIQFGDYKFISGLISGVIITALITVEKGIQI